MIVEYTKNAEQRWLRAGCNYAVQAIYFDTVQGTRYRIISEESAIPALFSVVDFTIIDGSIPASWRGHVHENGDFELSPVEWLQPGFWERYFDGESEAKQAFELYTSRID